MRRVSVCLPDELVRGIDEAASMLEQSRTAIIRQAIERYLDVLQDSEDPILVQVGKRKFARLRLRRD